MNNKLVLISGSGRGLGAGIAKSFANAGYKIAINYSKSFDKAKSLSEEIDCDSHIFKCDVSNDEEVHNMVDEIRDTFGEFPSILINNAMTSYVFNGDDRKTAEDITWNEIQRHLNVTLKGSINLIQALIPDMKKNAFGRIINVGTNLVQNPVVPYHDYIIAKAGLLGLTRSFAKDLDLIFDL